jgi:hypothetical protein
MHERVRELERQVDRLGKDVDRLSGWIELLLTGIGRIERSRTWSTGRLLVDKARRFTGRPSDATPFRETEELRDVFEHWKKSRD